MWWPDRRERSGCPHRDALAATCRKRSTWISYRRLNRFNGLLVFTVGSRMVTTEGNLPGFSSEKVSKEQNARSAALGWECRGCLLPTLPHWRDAFRPIVHIRAVFRSALTQAAARNYADPPIAATMWGFTLELVLLKPVSTSGATNWRLWRRSGISQLDPSVRRHDRARHSWKKARDDDAEAAAL